MPANARVSGRVALGGTSRPAALRRVTGLVPQTDTLLPSLTVAESVGYAAALRLAHRGSGGAGGAATGGVDLKVGSRKASIMVQLTLYGRPRAHKQAAFLR